MIYRAIGAAKGVEADAKYVDDTFATAARASFNTFRLFAHGVDYGIKLHEAPGAGLCSHSACLSRGGLAPVVAAHEQRHAHAASLDEMGGGGPINRVQCSSVARSI